MSLVVQTKYTDSLSNICLINRAVTFPYKRSGTVGNDVVMIKTTLS